jgi:hypothetical protein
VLANIGLTEPEFIRQQKGLAILLEGKPPILADWMDRHGEEPEIHGSRLPKASFLLTESVRALWCEDKSEVEFASPQQT